MASMINRAHAFAPGPRPNSADITPILLAVHLLGLVTAIALIVGLIPAAIALLVAGGWS